MYPSHSQVSARSMHAHSRVLPGASETTEWTESDREGERDARESARRTSRSVRANIGIPLSAACLARLAR